MTVHRDDDILQAGRQLVERREELRVLIGRGVADGVGDVDRGCAALNGDLEHLRGERRIRARGIHRAELHIVDEPLCLRDRSLGPLEHILARIAHLVLDVDIARRDERVDARAGSIGKRLASARDIGGLRAREATDHGPFDLSGNGLHGLKVAGAGDREAGLDDVDTKAGELLGDLQLLAGVQRDAGRLLAVAQRRVEDQNSVTTGHRKLRRSGPGCLARRKGWTTVARGGLYARPQA